METFHINIRIFEAQDFQENGIESKEIVYEKLSLRDKDAVIARLEEIVEELLEFCQSEREMHQEYVINTPLELFRQLCDKSSVSIDKSDNCRLTFKFEIDDYEEMSESISAELSSGFWCAGFDVTLSDAIDYTLWFE